MCICEPLANVNLFLYGAPAYARPCLLCSTLLISMCFICVLLHYRHISRLYSLGVRRGLIRALPLSIWLYISSARMCLHCRPDCVPAFETKKPLTLVRSGADGKGLRSVHSIEASQDTGQIYDYKAKTPLELTGGFLAFLAGVSKFQTLALSY